MLFHGKCYTTLLFNMFKHSNECIVINSQLFEQQKPFFVHFIVKKFSSLFCSNCELLLTFSLSYLHEMQQHRDKAFVHFIYMGPFQKEGPSKNNFSTETLNQKTIFKINLHAKQFMDAPKTVHYYHFIQKKQ